MFDFVGQEARLFGKLQTKKWEFQVTQAELLAIFTTPKIILPATPNIMYVPRLMQLVRAPGTAYTTATALVLNWQTSNAICMHSFDATIFGTGPQSGYLLGPSFNGTSVGGAAHYLSSRGGNRIEMTALTGNPTGGTGGLFCTLYYWKIPAARIANS